MSETRTVPIEPTDAMLRAGQNAWLKDPERKSSTLWRAMALAAPTALSSSAAAGSAGEELAETIRLKMNEPHFREWREKSASDLTEPGYLLAFKVRPTGTKSLIVRLVSGRDIFVGEDEWTPTPTEASRSETGRGEDVLRSALVELDRRIFHDAQVIERAGEWRDLIAAALAASDAALTARPAGDAAPQESAYVAAHLDACQDRPLFPANARIAHSFTARPVGEDALRVVHHEIEMEMRRNGQRLMTTTQSARLREAQLAALANQTQPAAGQRAALADVIAALDAAEIQECHVNGDKADVISAPPGSTFLNEHRLIARCSTGPLWIKQAVAIAKALNFVRSLTPAPQSDTGEA